MKFLKLNKWLIEHKCFNFTASCRGRNIIYSYHLVFRSNKENPKTLFINFKEGKFVKGWININQHNKIEFKKLSKLLKFVIKK